MASVSKCEGCGISGAKTHRGMCKDCSKVNRVVWHQLYKRRKAGRNNLPPLIVSKPAARIPMANCNVCGVDYKPKVGDRTTCCSRKCGHVWSGFKTKAIFTRLRVSVKIKRMPCDSCGGMFTSCGGDKCCSEDCASSVRNADRRNAEIEKYAPITFDCHECGISVVADYGFKRRVFCSNECSKRSSRRTRRKMERARLREVQVEPVDPTKVLERDGWRCQLCKAKTPRSKRGSIDDNAPELDHIMPLSLGGDHSYRNTQCLCRKCNRDKSNTPMGQLVLL